MLWISARFHEMGEIEKVIASKNVFFKYLFSSSINIVNVQGIKPTATSLLGTTRNCWYIQLKNIEKETQLIYKESMYSRMPMYCRKNVMRGRLIKGIEILVIVILKLKALFFSQERHNMSLKKFSLCII